MNILPKIYIKREKIWLKDRKFNYGDLVGVKDNVYSRYINIEYIGRIVGFERKRRKKVMVVVEFSNIGGQLWHKRFNQVILTKVSIKRSLVIIWPWQ